MDLAGLNNEQPSSGFNLADLGNFDTSELSPLMNRLPVEGIFTVKVTKPKLAEQVSQDPAKPSLWRASWSHEILEAQPKDKNVDAAALVGKSIPESYTIWPTDAQDLIRVLMGRYMTAGFPHKGRVGGIEGQEPGWLDSADGQIIKLRVRHFKTNDGVEKAGFDWLKYEAPKE